LRNPRELIGRHNREFRAHAVISIGLMKMSSSGTGNPSSISVST
jgi:hypothetical protein